jgi:hypothetical protein
MLSEEAFETRPVELPSSVIEPGLLDGAESPPCMRTAFAWGAEAPASTLTPGTMQAKIAAMTRGRLPNMFVVSAPSYSE